MIAQNETVALTIRLRPEDLAFLKEIARQKKKGEAVLAADFVLYCLDRIAIARGRDVKRVENGRAPTLEVTPALSLPCPPASPEEKLAAKREQERSRQKLLRMKGLCGSCCAPKEPYRLHTARCQSCSDRRR